MIKYQQKRCFRSLSETITEARRAGDINPDSKIVAETRKTQGNVSYGCLCMDKTKHSNTCYFKGNIKHSQAVNKPQFWKLSCFHEEEEFYEVEFAKDGIKLDVPIQIALFILNLAKLRMLQFHYDFLDRLVDRSDHQKWTRTVVKWPSANRIWRQYISMRSMASATMVLLCPSNIFHVHVAKACSEWQTRTGCI